MDTLAVLREKYIFRLFRLGIFLKGLLSLAELFAGFFLLLVSPAAIGGVIVNIALHELAEDPGSFFATHALPIAQQFSVTSQAFIVLYLLSRGLIKLALVVALLKGKLWAYPAALIALSLFMVYQIYEIALKHSIFLIALTLFDIIIMWLIWHEYSLVRKHVKPGAVGDVIR